jgi:hypothetical protein
LALINPNAAVENLANETCPPDAFAFEVVLPTWDDVASYACAENWRVDPIIVVACFAILYIRHNEQVEVRIRSMVAT